LAFHQPAAHQLRSDNFCGAAEERERQSWEIFADVLGGYGSGWSDNLLHPSLTKLLAGETMK
jgi:hypothetical protein